MAREWELLAESFREYHHDWPAVHNKVLRLARYQGAIAALTQEIVDGPLTRPGFVSYASLQVASLFVQLACPSGEGASLLTGKHCPVPVLDDLDRDTVRKLRSLLQSTGSPAEWEKLLG
jgi:hypothetical protein